MPSLDIIIPDHIREWQIGMPLKGIFFELPPTRPETPLSKMKRSTQGLPGLFADKDVIGPRLFFVLSIMWDKEDVNPATHTPSIADKETQPFALAWGAPINCKGVWGKLASRIYFNLPVRCIEPMLPILGTSEDHILFTLSRLVPRKVPAALRVISPNHFQYWASL